MTCWQLSFATLEAAFLAVGLVDVTAENAGAQPGSI
jgi:hypothetical protein